MIDLDRQGDVFVLRMDSGENRFGADFIDAFNQRLDEAEKSDGPKALVTIGSGKFYSNGLDLEHMMSCGAPQAYLHAVLAILGRILTLPMATVAAVNGHAFGAGAQMAVVHDYRLMRADRGFFCMPEVDMKVGLHPAMIEILKAGLPARTCREVVATGRRYGGLEAAAKGIADEALAEAELLPAALELAAGLAPKADPAMGVLKAALVPQVLAALEAPIPGLGGA